MVNLVDVKNFGWYIYFLFIGSIVLDAFISSAMQLTEELTLVKDLLGLPVYEPLSGAKVNQIRVIVKSCLEASLYLATGFYLIDKDEVKLKTDVTTSGEEFCRKYGWKSSELSVREYRFLRRFYVKLN